VRELFLDRLSAPQITLLRHLVAVAGRRALALVGGAARDGVARRRPPAIDLDVAIDSGALSVGRRLAARAGGAFVALDTERDAARVVVGEHRLDLARFRAPPLEADLAARDYTVNALAVPVRELLARGRAPIVDPTGGLRDLAARRLRPPHPRVLAEDPLRALRGVRLERALGLRLTPGAVRAIRSVAPALADVSAERVRDELVALLAGADAARAQRRLAALGLLRVVLPEVEPMRRTAQPAPHRFAVLEHSLRAVAGADRVLARPAALARFGDAIARHAAESLGGGVTRREVLKLAALLHDVSKPETRRRVAGRVRFFEHDVRGAARARAIGERLRLPARATAVLERLVRHHLRPMHLAAAGAVTPRARYRFYRDLGSDTQDLIVLALVDAAAVRGESPFAVWPRARLLRELLAGWPAQQSVATAPPLLRGEDVMRRFALGPGPEVGRLLRRAREAQDLGLVATAQEALAFLDSSGAGP
jgi:putative nucleotidyltransferase with HDIG domain